MPRFADDIAVISENNEDLQQILRTVEDTMLYKINIKINVKKTEVLVRSMDNNTRARILMCLPRNYFYQETENRSKQQSSHTYEIRIMYTDEKSKNKIIERMCKAKIALKQKQETFYFEKYQPI